MSSFVDGVDRDALGLRVGVPLGRHQLVARADQQCVEHFGPSLEGGCRTDVEVDVLAAHRDRPRDVTTDSLAQHLHRVDALRSDRQHELVAAEPGGDQIGPADLVDAIGDRGEHGVADRFAVQLVDRAEVDDVDHEDPETTAALHQRVRSPHEPVAIQQARAAVVLGEELDPVTCVGQGGGDLGADDVALDDRIVEQVVDGELADQRVAARRRALVHRG